MLSRGAGLEVQRLRGGDFSVRIRGGSSGLGGEPLWVVDGTPMPQGVSPSALLAGIDPGAVARIDVLKGASATVYGMRGINGVILVTLRGARR
jgi:TonB-dependent SusC/RagA subfamily outer membrane receptor